MPTLQELLNDVDSRYRNTYTTAQKVAWMNMVQRQIYQIIRHESLPYRFQTVVDLAFYPLPGDMDVRNIEQVALQINDSVTDPQYEQLDYKRKDEEASEGERFYSIVERDFFLYPTPTTAGRNVIIYYIEKPTALTETNLDATPDLDEAFQELLVLGTLERICAARKDSEMKSNYANDFNMMLDEYEFMLKVTDPEFVQPIDVMPRSGVRHGRTVVTTVTEIV